MMTKTTTIMMVMIMMITIMMIVVMMMIWRRKKKTKKEGLYWLYIYCAWCRFERKRHCKNASANLKIER